MDRAEVGEVTVVVELLGDNGITGDLHEIKTGARDEVTCDEEVTELLADIRAHIEDLAPVVRINNASLITAGIAHDLCLDNVEGVIELLLEDHEVEVAGEKAFVAGKRVDVVRLNLLLNKLEQLLNHENEDIRLSLVLCLLRRRLLVEVLNVHEEIVLEETNTDLSIRLVGISTEHTTEVTADVSKNIVAGSKAKLLRLTEHEFSTLRLERIIGVVHGDLLVDLAVRGASETLEDEDGGDEELLLADNETDVDGTSFKIVNVDGDSRLVLTNATHGSGIFGVLRTTAEEGGTNHAENVITARHDEHTHESFVTVKNEVATPFTGLFSVRNHVLTGKILKVATSRANHDRHATHITRQSLNSTLTNTALDSHSHGRIVGDTELTSLMGIETRLVIRTGVGGLADANIGDTECDFGNIGHSSVRTDSHSGEVLHSKIKTAIIIKHPIKGLNMRSNQFIKGRGICFMIMCELRLMSLFYELL